MVEALAAEGSVQVLRLFCVNFLKMMLDVEDIFKGIPEVDVGLGGCMKAMDAEGSGQVFVELDHYGFVTCGYFK